MRDLPQRYFIDGVPFWNAPVVYLMAETRLHRAEHERFLKDFGYEARDDQFTGTDAEVLVEDAGRTCYLSYHPESKGRSHAAYLRNIKTQNHGSVAEHASVTLKICGVSRGLTHELVRHRVGVAISQTSSRYVDARRLGFVVPPLLRDDASLREDFEMHCLKALSQYESVVEHLVAAHGRKTARGAAREFLPIGLAQMITFSFNVRSYRHILRMRGSAGAEKQIRELALLMAPIAAELWPELCADLQEVWTDDGIGPCVSVDPEI